MNDVAQDGHIPFQKMRNNMVRINPRFGVQEISARPCQKGGDVFLVMRSGDRMIGFSLLGNEVSDLLELLANAQADSTSE